MGDSLKIQVIVDGSQVSSGMNGVTASVEAATARIKASFGSIEKAPAGIQNALKVLQNQARMSGETVAFATEQINALGDAAGGAVPQVERLSSSTDQATRSLVEARLAAQLFGHEIGVTMPRALTTVLARSETLGPALNAAFSGIALAGFIELAVVAGEKLGQLISDTFIFTDAEKKLYAQEVSLNQKILHGLEEHKKLLRDISVIGLPLAEAEKKRAQFAREDADGLKSQIEQSEKQLQLEKEKLQVLQRQKSEAASQTINVGRAGIRSADQGQFDQAIKDQEIAVRTLSDSIVGLRSDYTLAGDAVVAAQKKFDSTALKDSEKAATKFQAAMEKLARELRHISDEKERLDILTRKLAEDQAEFGAKEGAKETEAATKALIERDEAEREFRQARIEDEKQASVAEIELEQAKVKERFRLGQITANQELEQLNALEAQKLAIEKTYLQKRIDEILARINSDDAKTYKEDLKEWSKLLSDKQKAEDNYQKNRQKNTENAAVSEEKIWEKMTRGINRLFDQAIQGIVQGTVTLGAAFGRIIDGMLAKFIEATLQMLEQWIVTHVLMIAVKKDAQSKQVLSDAKAAAAAAWKAVVGIPIIGPELAPIAAATAFAGVEAFSAAGGMDFVPADNTLALLHKREMVLPASISDSIRGITNFAVQGGAGVSDGARSSGGPQISIQFGDINAIDARGVQDVLTKQSAHIVKIVRSELRRTNSL